MSKEVMRQAFENMQKNERHTSYGETQYWCNQYKMFAVRLLTELAKPANEFNPDWDTLKPYHDRIAELEAQLAKPEYSDLRKAAEMALEALEMHVLGFDGVRKMELAIEALESALAKPDETETLKRCLFQMQEAAKALAQPEHPLDKKADNARELGLDYEPDHGFDRTASHMAGEYVDTANQEPVAWHSHNPDYPIQDGDWVEVIFTSGQPDDAKKWTPLYTAPQKPDVTLIDEGKTWQGLTDDEIRLMAHNDDEGDWNDLKFRDIWHSGYLAGFRSAEAKLREKNT